MKNESTHKFVDISTEQFREYVFANGCVMIDEPTHLSVSKSGGHRLLDADGVSHYIPAGWIHLRWRAKSGAANFVA